MIGIDTNVLVRYIVQDDPSQSQKAGHYLEANCNTTHPGFINSLVLCELVWVLKRAYKYNKTVIAEVIENILCTSELLVENSSAAWDALRAYKSGSADFPDYLIGEINSSKDCEFTITFDKKTTGSKHFQILE